MTPSLKEKFSQTNKDNSGYANYVARSYRQKSKNRYDSPLILTELNPEYFSKIDREALQALKNSTVE